MMNLEIVLVELEASSPMLQADLKEFEVGELWLILPALCDS